MKRGLSILAVALLSSVGWGAASEPAGGTPVLDGSEGSDGEALVPRRPRCNPACVAGVRG